ncbi:PD-(D/E)XK nuclease family protein [Oscillatoria sp. FACHB-1407]|uniref:PD-(D/E)XK nuclease family protein n=1 Tax=Oscillatoria sp. FACHB-1407 TaxID=2692847 RepID=UPI001689C862|nr:PD-(D/E)XK nuclease family protein [Oscillatoria sp. FACHB-1407]MBD2461766.1 PD-(D/E)XK nuclease family protein [Oscillatoria sp. FACHB-1407]
MLPKPQLLPSYSAKSVREGGRSYFVDARGVRLPSVSTILNATKPQEAREALARWRDRLGAEVAGQVTSRASRRGTQTHKYIRHYLLGEEMSCPDTVKPYWESIEPVLAEIQEVRLVENAVFHYDLGYAGKVDCVASYQGIPCICDWKTADAPKGSIERLHDGPLQLAAYCGAVNHSYVEHGVHLRHALLVVAIPDQKAEVFWFEPEDLVHQWHQWQARVAEFERFRRRW